MAEEQACADSKVEVKTGFGSVLLQGKRNAELIAALALAALLLVGYMTFEHSQDTKQGRIDRSKQIDQIASALDRLSISQREMTCIISLPQDKREAEYRSPHGMCKRVSGSAQ